MFIVYILKSLVDGSLYTGQTKDIKDRLSRHNRGLIKTTKGRAPYELGYFEEFVTRRQAMWREWELKKRYNTDRKKRLIADFDHKKIERILGL
ncbi:MAG: GIY-YIG domain-containing protein [Bacteroidia bacterium]|nr:MAG: GIY-YIG domain-containing protein [Bacteroidia bacterium]